MRFFIAILVVFSVISCGGGSSENGNTKNTGPTLQLSSSATSVKAGESITITADAKDSDGSIVSYQWLQTSGTGVELASDATTTLILIAPNVTVTENLTIVLTVKDNDGASIQKSVTIEIKEINIAPTITIESSHATASVGIKVDLSANVTDEDISSITYLWKQIKGPELVLSAITSSTLNFVVPELSSATDIILSLQVTDNIGQMSTAQISISLLPKQSIPPEVYPLSYDLNLISLEKILLSVSATDSDGEIVSYQWQQTSGPDLTFEDHGVDNLSVTVPELNSHQLATFQITVMDDDGLSSQTTLSMNLFPRYQVTTLKGRTDGKGVDLIILAEGFSQDELPQFEQAVTDFIQAFDQEETIKIHQQAWNIHRINSISQESGADFPEDNVYVNTVFDAYFQCGSIARLLCINSSKVLAVTAKITPQFDQVIVIVNSSTYGGAGGQVATFSMANSAERIAIHELGHSFAGLADEYSYGATDDTIYEPNEPNATTITIPTEVKWRHWFEDIDNIPTEIGQTGVGLFEGARYHTKNYYRPLDNSIMKELDQPFGPINAEAWALNIYSTAGSILSIRPDEENVNHVSDTPLIFKINPVHAPDNNKITWLVNGIEQSSDLNTPTQLTLNTPPSSNYSVKVEIIDNSGLIKKDTLQQAKTSFTWSVTAQ
jgi:hypothetical protein